MDAKPGGSERFELTRLLGSGSMGQVYEAVDRKRGARVAVKALNLSTPEMRLHLKREFRALHGLQHPNLVSFGELVEDDGELFLTMELVEGVSFYEYVCGVPQRRFREQHQLALMATMLPEHEGPESGDEDAAVRDLDTRPPAFDEQRLRSTLSQLAIGLDALHQFGKIHRDVKPSNVLVTEQGRVVILDFGLAIDPTEASDWSEVAVVGTVAYMAPEQAVSKDIGPPSDWYSVGTMLYEVLTGRIPFTGSPFDILVAKQRDEPPSPATLNPGIPDDLDRLCRELLQFDPRKRPTGPRILRRLGAQQITTPAHDTFSTSTASAPFVGREAELAKLREAFAAACAGQTVTVFVHGESGMGKTTLVNRHLTGIEQRAVILRGRCYERESIPFKALDEVTEQLTRHLRTLEAEQVRALLPDDWEVIVDVFPVLRRVRALREAARIGPGVAPQEQRNQLFAAFRALLHNLADRQPLVICVDDFQWADLDSIALWIEVIRDEPVHRLLFIPVLRDAPRIGRRLREYAREIGGDVRRVKVDRLPESDAYLLATRLLQTGRMPDGIDAESVVAEARGHPLFIDELVSHARLTGDGTTPLRLEDALWQRISSLGAAELELLELISVAGAPIARETLSAATDLDYGPLSRHAAVLRIARLVHTVARRADDHLEPYHDRVRRIVLKHMSDDAQEACHQKIADALETSGAAEDRPELMMRHLAASGRRRRAARYAIRAAERANAALAFERAARLYRIARRDGEFEGEELGKLDRDLGDARRHAGQGRRAAGAYLRAARRSDPPTRRACYRRAAEQLLITGHIRGGLAVLDNLLAEEQVSMPVSPKRALASLLWQRLRLKLRGLRWNETHPSEVSARALSRIDVFQVVGQGLGAVDSIRGADFQARCLRAALDAGEPTRIARALVMEAIFVATRGGRHVNRARELVRRARTIADGHDEPALTAFAVAVDGILYYFSGDFRTAFERFSEAEPTFRKLTGDSTFELNNVRLMGMFSLRHMGAFRDWKPLQETFVRDAVRRGDRYSETSMRRTGSLLHLAGDRPDLAREALEATSWSPPAKGYHLQHWYQAEGRAELALYEGTAPDYLESARAVLASLKQSMLSRIEIVWTMALLAWGKVAVTAATHPASRARGLRDAHKAAAMLARGGSPLTAVLTKLLTAGIANVEGDTTRAKALLAELEREAKDQYMLAIAAAARYYRGTLSEPPDRARRMDSAHKWMRTAGIEAPERMARVLVPGFGSTPD